MASDGVARTKAPPSRGASSAFLRGSCASPGTRTSFWEYLYLPSYYLPARMTRTFTQVGGGKEPANGADTQ